MVCYSQDLLCLNNTLSKHPVFRTRPEWHNSSPTVIPTQRPPRPLRDKGRVSPTTVLGRWDVSTTGFTFPVKHFRRGRRRGIRKETEIKVDGVIFISLKKRKDEISKHFLERTSPDLVRTSPSMGRVVGQSVTPFDTQNLTSLTGRQGTDQQPFLPNRKYKDVVWVLSQIVQIYRLLMWRQFLVWDGGI